MGDRTTRRTFLAGSAAAGLAVALGACGDDEPRSVPLGAGGEFPVRVAHKFGTTVVERAPRRIATYGGGDADTLLALGFVPVLVPDIDPRWKRLGGVGPWARSRLRGAKPLVVSNQELQFEHVARSRPDLITAVEYDLKRGDYDKLAQLAPTIPPPKGFAPYTVPWDRIALQVGESLGRRGDARRLVDDARRRIRDAASPAFSGKRVILIDPDDDGGVYVFAPNDVRTRFLEELGMTLPDSVRELFDENFYAQISAERLDLLDEADLLICVAVRKPQTKKLVASRSFQRLRNVRSGRVIVIDDPDLAIAMSYSTPLSIPFQLQAIVPRMRAALAA